MSIRELHSPIGIWGFSVTGQSVARFLRRHTADPIIIYDEKPLSPTASALCTQYNLTLSNNLNELFECATIIPSAGIDLSSHYDTISTRLLTELDLFSIVNTAPTIGVTGSFGKTSLCTIIHSLLTASNTESLLGGNIGIGMMDIATNKADYKVLELSSFQLEYATHFAPDIAIIGAITPNHLDRHKTMDAYQNAKLNLIAHQSPSQITLSHVDNLQAITKRFPNKRVTYIAPHLTPTAHQQSKYQPIYTFDDAQNVIQLHKGFKTVLAPREAVPTSSFSSNWLFGIALLDTIGLPLPALTKLQLTLPPHRLELVTTHNGITYYNDSKSTVTETTLAAIHALNSPNIILLLGGLSKGVDRMPLIQQLAGKVKTIITFGKEASTLHEWSKQCGIPTTQTDTLDEALEHAHTSAIEKDIILLSPAGASFDLFTDYQERGNHFKSLVLKKSSGTLS